MLAFPDMLIDAAYKAGIAIPENINNYDRNEFPHFYVFCYLQLGRPVRYHGEHWDNAKVIANIPVERLKVMTLEEFINEGLSFAS